MSGCHGPPERFLSKLLEGIVCNYQDKIELLNGLFCCIWSFNIYVKMVCTHTIKFHKYFIKMRNEAKEKMCLFWYDWTSNGIFYKVFDTWTPIISDFLFCFVSRLSMQPRLDLNL